MNWVIGLLLFGVLMTGNSRAEESQKNPKTHKEGKSKKKLPRRPVEKEAEGSKAPNRFESDPVIHSEYQHGGQSLEVDPD